MVHIVFCSFMMACVIVSFCAASEKAFGFTYTLASLLGTIKDVQHTKKTEETTGATDYTQKIEETILLTAHDGSSSGLMRVQETRQGASQETYCAYNKKGEEEFQESLTSAEFEFARAMFVFINQSKCREASSEQKTVSTTPTQADQKKSSWFGFSRKTKKTT